MSKFKIFKAKNEQYYFVLVAWNWEPILKSEMYKALQSAYKWIESVKKNSQDDSKFERKTSSNDKFYFNLKAWNWEVIWTSEMYESKQWMEKWIESVKNNAFDA